MLFYAAGVLLLTSSMAVIAMTLAGIAYALVMSVRALFLAVSGEIHRDKHNHADDERRSCFLGAGYERLKSILGSSLSKLKNDMPKASGYSENAANFIADILFNVIFLPVSSCCMCFFWLAFTLIFSGIFLSAAFFAEVLVFLCYIILKLSGKYICPDCGRKVTPLFVCPVCRKPQILPAVSYGIFYKKCSCGATLPAGLFRRNNLIALCPVCGHYLNVERFGIQVVGGSSTETSEYISVFFNEYRKIFPSYVKCTLHINNDESNSITHEFSANAPFQLELYDVNDDPSERQRHYMKSRGVIIIIDPDESPSAIHAAVSSFCAEHKRMRNLSVSQMSPIPVAVAVTKADKYVGAISEDPVKFLELHGLGAVVRLISSEFITAKYFAVNISCHDGGSEPIMWILRGGIPRIFQHQ